MNCSIDKLLVMFWNLSACFRPKGLSACIPSETGEACFSFALIWCPKFLWRKFRLSMSESTEECTCVCLRLTGLLGRLQPLQVWNRNEHPYPVCSVTFWNRWGKTVSKSKQRNESRDFSWYDEVHHTSTTALTKGEPATLQRSPPARLNHPKTMH